MVEDLRHSSDLYQKIASNPRFVAETSLLSSVRLAYGLIPFISELDARGIKTAEILELINIPQFGLVDPNYTISFEQELAFVRQAIKRIPDTHLSIAVANRYDLRSFSILGLAMQSCRTIGDMMTLLYRYPRLTWGSCRMEIFEKEGVRISRLMPEPEQEECERFLKERDLAAGLNVQRQAAGKRISYLKVHLTFPEPVYPEIYEHFFGCPVLYDQEFVEVYADPAQGNTPIPSGDDRAREFFEAQCAEVSSRLSNEFLYAESVRQRLTRTTPIPRLEVIAEQMSMTPRTLQRRLKSEGIQFSELLQQVRERAAKELLTTKQANLDQIAWRLGFSDAVAFSHAFKSWTGVSPSKWRDLSPA